jgi:hypothetical protein
MAVQQKQASDRTRETTQKRRSPEPQGPATLSEQADLLALQRAVADPTVASPADVLALQRIAGNRAVTGLIQAKLQVGPVGDRYEREADRVAERVMAMPLPTSQSLLRQEGEVAQMKPLAASITPAVQRQEVPEEEELLQMSPLIQRQEPEEEEELIQMSPLVQRQEPEEEEELLQMSPLVQRQEPEEEELLQMSPLVQRQEPEEEELLQMRSLGQRDGREGFQASANVERKLTSLRGTGSPLPDDVRAFMEPRFGADLGGVRLHSGGEAAQLSQQLQAKAFTHGRDIYFGSGNYDPGTASGKRLLAHELTHVIQQSGGGNKVQRWGSVGGGTSHVIVTQDALKGVTGYSHQAQEYLAEASEMMDLRAGFFAGFLVGKAWQTIRSKMATDPEHYDNLVGYWRPESEAPNHAEAGRYKTDGATQDMAHVNSLVDRAKNAWDGDNRTEALTMLGLALHSAQDRGAHGDGRPGEGHDPRRTVKPPEGARTNYYTPGWDGTDCDKMSKNPEGYTRAVVFAREVLTEFRDYVAESGDAKNLSLMNQKGMGARKAGRYVKTFFGGEWASSERSPAWEQLGNPARNVLIAKGFIRQDVDSLSEGHQQRLVKWQQAGDLSVPDEILNPLQKAKKEREEKEGPEGPAWDRLSDKTRQSLFFTGYRPEDVARLPKDIQEKLVAWKPGGGVEEYIPDEIMDPLKEKKEFRERYGTFGLAKLSIPDLSAEERVAKINRIMRLEAGERMALLNYLEENAEWLSAGERTAIVYKFMAGPKVLGYMRDHWHDLTEGERQAITEMGYRDKMWEKKASLTREDWEARGKTVATDAKAREQEKKKGKLQWWLEEEEETPTSEKSLAGILDLLKTQLGTEGASLLELLKLMLGEKGGAPKETVGETVKQVIKGAVKKEESGVSPEKEGLSPAQLKEIFLHLSGKHYQWLTPVGAGTKGAIDVGGSWFVLQDVAKDGNCQFNAMTVGLAFLKKGEHKPAELRKTAAAAIRAVPQLQNAARMQVFDMLSQEGEGSGLSPAFRKKLKGKLEETKKKPEYQETEKREHYYGLWSKFSGFEAAVKRLQQAREQLKTAKTEKERALAQKQVDQAKEEHDKLMKTKAYQRHSEVRKGAQNKWEAVLQDVALQLVPDYTDAVEKEPSMWGDQTTLEALKLHFDVKVHVHGHGA